jgi:hypothetical protein
MRDLRIGVRSRLSAEHEFPSSQSATSEAGKHKFVTMQQQATQPTLAGTQIGVLYVKTVGTTGNELYFARSGTGAAEVLITNGTGINAPAVSFDGTMINTNTAGALVVGNAFGAWVDKSANYGAQQAPTDGWVQCNIIYSNATDSEEWVTGYTDAASNPTTARARCATGKVSTYEGYIRQNSFLMPVRKGDYWKVVNEGNNTPTIAVYWLPIGS